MPELPPLPQPYPYLRVGHYGAAALPEGIGTHIDLTRVDVDQALADGLDCVVVSAAGSTERFAPQMLQLLTACEAAGVPTVLRTGLQEDLRSPVAAVVSHLALETEELYGQALRMVGPERAFAIQQPVDPCQVLTQGTEDPHQLSPEAIAERREALAEKSPRAQADRFMRFIGLPVEPEPLVTALIISRHAKNLHYSLENLKRQNYPRIDPLLVIDPIYEQQAREITADWDIPVRIAAANPPEPAGGQTEHRCTARPRGGSRRHRGDWALRRRLSHRPAAGAAGIRSPPGGQSKLVRLGPEEAENCGDGGGETTAVRPGASLGDHGLSPRNRPSPGFHQKGPAGERSIRRPNPNRWRARVRLALVRHCASESRPDCGGSRRWSYEP